jgi:cell division protein FtsI (penicillin-binding protein 3)
MAEKRKPTRKKQQSVTEKSALQVEMWRFISCGQWFCCAFCFGWTCFLCAGHQQRLLQNKANANILRTEKVKPCAVMTVMVCLWRSVHRYESGD